MNEKQIQHLINSNEALHRAVGHLLHGLPLNVKLSAYAEQQFAREYGRASTELQQARDAAGDDAAKAEAARALK